jgi:hypothetical protein
VYSELESRIPTFIAVTKALKKALEEDDFRPTLSGIIIEDSSGDIVETSGKVPIYTARDERNFVQYQTPSVVIFQPHPFIMSDMITNLKRYREYDNETGTVTEFEEPVPTKLRFRIHLATRNPDNDAILTTWFWRLREELTGLYVQLSPDVEEYDRMTLYWHEPEEMDSDDISKIREFQVDARTRIETLRARKRKLVNLANAVDFSSYDPSSTESTIITTRNAFNVSAEDTEIMVNGVLDDWPVSGSAEFDDGDVFSYSSRDRRQFKEVSGVDSFHHFDSVISYRE